LIGSTEYGEDFTEWLKAHAVAYINVDVSAAGSRWGAAGSPSLAHLIRQSALDIPHPTAVGKTLWDAQNDNGPLSLQNGIVDPQFLQAVEAAEARHLAAKNIIVGPLGSGSDFTVFLQRIGVRPHSLACAHVTELLEKHRLLARLRHSAVPPSTQCTIIILSMTAKGSRSCMLILVSTAPLVPFYFFQRFLKSS
jgi:hypothetical protein